MHIICIGDSVYGYIPIFQKNSIISHYIIEMTNTCSIYENRVLAKYFKKIPKFGD